MVLGMAPPPVAKPQPKPQLKVEANPILTEISDCMTGEGKALERGDKEAAVAFAARKDAANSKLQACSAKYNTLMKEMREKGWA